MRSTLLQHAPWLLTLALLACGGDNATAGHRITLQTVMRAHPETLQPFVTDTGWTVTLTRAAVSIGALYYFDGEPAFARRPLPRRWLARALGLGVARAHPGHYTAGRALGQMTTPTPVDLLAGPTQLPDGTGITGSFRSARFKLTASRAEPDLLAERVAIAEGVARRGSGEVYFRLRARYEDVAKSASQGDVDGCAFEEAEVERSGTVTVTVSPRVWLGLVDFSEIAPGSAAAPTEVAPGATAQLAFALGVAQRSAYRFSFAPQSPLTSSPR